MGTAVPIRAWPQAVMEGQGWGWHVPSPEVSYAHMQLGSAFSTLDKRGLSLLGVGTLAQCQGNGS